MSTSRTLFASILSLISSCLFVFVSINVSIASNLGLRSQLTIVDETYTLSLLGGTPSSINATNHTKVSNATTNASVSDEPFIGHFTNPGPNCTVAAHQKVEYINFTAVRPLSDLVGGSFWRLRENEDNASVCGFVPKQGAFKFPHGMQQLYRCFAFWRHFNMTRPVLVWPQKPLRQTPYLDGMLDAFRDVFNVTIIKKTPPEWPIVVNAKRYEGPSHSHPHAGYAFQDVHDTAVLRDAMLQHYNLLDDEMKAGCKRETAKTKPVIGILNRKLRRSVANLDSLVDGIYEAFGQRVEVKYFENATFFEQIAYFSQVDILLSPHGAQLTSLPFMPDCGGVIEFFPVAYLLPQFFGSLAAASRLHHGFYYSGQNGTREWAWALTNRTGREAARTYDMCVDVPEIVNGIQVLIDKWTKCCNSGT